jgi:hypothetical protein
MWGESDFFGRIFFVMKRVCHDSKHIAYVNRRGDVGRRNGLCVRNGAEHGAGHRAGHGAAHRGLGGMIWRNQRTPTVFSSSRK